MGLLKIPVGLQLYSLRDQCETDLPGMLAAVSKIGYQGVEFAGYHGRSARELKQMLDDHGLIACGTHTPLESLMGDKLKETIDFNRTLGNKFLIAPFMEGKSKQEWLEKANRFNELVPRLAPENMRIGYHAHSQDFEKFEGVSAWDLFFGHTSPEVVMQLDTSNCIDGGVDPVAVLKQYPGRVQTIHMKPNGSGPEAAIGDDQIAWKDVFEFCEGPGRTEWYVVEHETSKDPIDAVRRDFEGLRKLGRI